MIINVSRYIPRYLVPGIMMVWYLGNLDLIGVLLEEKKTNATGFTVARKLDT